MSESFASVHHLTDALGGPVRDLEIWMHLLTDYIGRTDHDPEAAYLLAVAALLEVRKIGGIYRRADPEADPSIEQRLSKQIHESFMAGKRRSA